MEESHLCASLALDVLIVAVAAVLLVAAFGSGLETGNPAKRGAGSILGGVYLIYLGVLFLLSYLAPRRSHIIKFLRYLCEKRSRPNGRGMAWLYFALSFTFGSGLLLVGLGVL